MTTQPSHTSDTDALAHIIPAPAEREMPLGRQHVIRQHLLSEFRTSATEAADGPMRGRQGRLRVPRKIQVALATATTVAAAATGVVFAAVGSTTTHHGSSPTSANCLAFGACDDPLPGGVPTTIARARSAANFPIILPHDPLADRRSLSSIWVNPADSVVALLYHQRRITILIKRWPVAQNPAKWFRYERRIMRTKYVRIGQAKAGPALIVPRSNIDYCHANPASVEFYWRGSDITVFSKRYTAAALLRIADSMR